MRKETLGPALNFRPKSSAMDIVIRVPHWVDELSQGRAYTTAEQKMALCVELARQNVELGGSPFGAAVFDGDHLIAAGVNLVLSSGLSIAHAEIVAILRSQQRSRDTRPLALYTSAEPCCQCYGALYWSHVRTLVCGATTYDVERIGFNEGPKPPRWVELLEENGFHVARELLRDEANAALLAYSARRGPLYGLLPESSR